jgi:hemolysin III
MNEHDPVWERYYNTLPDGGPQYTETDLSHFIAEPWNAVSSLLFLVPAFYWLWKIRGRIKENYFIAFCVPLLVLGGLGSTFFHAFRSSYLLLLMDFLPIAVLTFAVSIYMWKRVLGSWPLTALITLTGLSLRLFLFNFVKVSHHTAINISYVISGMMILIPALIVMWRTRFYRISSIILTVVSFAIALFFREVDARGLFPLPMGTHFLWHAFCAAGAHWLADYIYSISSMNIESDNKSNI